MAAIWDRCLEQALRQSLRGLGGDVLDLGCGTKPYRGFMVPPARRWVGLDYPTARADRVQKQDVSGTATEIPFRSQCFDVVLCTQVMEHLAEPGVALCECARVLRPGGHLVLSAPQQVDSLHEEPYDFFRYTRYGLQHLCSKAGLQVEQTVQLGGVIRLLAEIATRHAGPFRRVPLWAPVLAKVGPWADDVVSARVPGAAKAAMGWVVVARKTAA